MTLCCDQAIFTSIRTPMGEGYRIIAASRGLRPDDKQAITRHCPSHEGLCHVLPSPGDQGSGPEAAAFYALPNGRLCVALSCFAGAEHTGRGGQRVYTHCAVFDHKDFEHCGYNAFNVLRAMVTAGLTSPQLKPKNPLPELHLSVDLSPDRTALLALHADLDATCRGRILQGLFDGRSMIIDIAGTWLESTEVLLLGMPGPARTSVSFSAGTRFSLGRGHRLYLLHDVRGEAKTRVSGQPIDFIDPRKQHDGSLPDSAWLTFVERCWSTGDTVTLARRTSRGVADVSPAGRECIGQLYNDIDDLPDTDAARLLGMAGRHLESRSSGLQREITGQLLAEIKKELTRRLISASWTEAKHHWSALIDILTQSENGAAFAGAPLQQALRCAMRDDPFGAASVAIDLASPGLPSNGNRAFAGVLEDVVRKLATWARSAPDTHHEQLRSLCDRWHSLRPGCPHIDEIRRTCATSVAPS